MKKAILASILIVLAVGGLFVLLPSNKTPRTISAEERILNTIVREFPSLSTNGQPVIELDSVSVHDNGWYVTAIKSLHPVKNPVSVRVVLLETDGQIRTILGPDTYFSEEEMLTLNLPDSVILEILES